MPKKQHRGTHGSLKPLQRWSARRSQLAILGGVILLAAVVLVLKNRPTDPPTATDSRPQATTTALTFQATAMLPETVRQAQATTGLDRTGLQVPATALPTDLPEAQLHRHLVAGKPTLAFFHSNNCKQCINMMQVVEEVYPEFADSVALVDVNVYDERNTALLRWAHVHAIPTQIFFNSAGERQTVLGAMDPGTFRAYLRVASEGP